MIPASSILVVAGELKLMYPEDFCKEIPVERVNNPDAVQQAQFPWLPEMCENGDIPVAVDVSHKQIQLDTIVTESVGPHLSEVSLTAFIDKEVSRKCLDYMKKELFIKTAKRVPEFRVKDLNMESINGLSARYAEQMGNYPCGIHLDLSKYQKFFIIANPKSFKFYQFIGQRHDLMEPYPSLHVRGKLVNDNDSHFLMGRYENLVYINELNALRMDRTEVSK